MTEIIDGGAQGSVRNREDAEMQKKGTDGVSRHSEDVSVQTVACLDAKAAAKLAAFLDAKPAAKLATSLEGEATAKCTTSLKAETTAKLATSLKVKAAAKPAASPKGEAAAKRTVCSEKPGSQSDSRPRVVRGAWAGCGFLMFGLGALGAVIPLLPTIPFLMVAAFCFARSSERLDVWFRSTSLYRKVLEGYVARRAMTLRSKLLLLGPVTLLLGISFMLMANVPAGRVAVAVIWAAHLVYFGFVVKTARNCEGPRMDAGSVAPRRAVTDAESGR